MTSAGKGEGVAPAAVTKTQSGVTDSNVGVGDGSLVFTSPFGIKKWPFQRVLVMYRPLAETSVIEFTAEARLGRAGGTSGSERSLRRIKLYTPVRFTLR